MARALLPVPARVTADAAFLVENESVTIFSENRRKITPQPFGQRTTSRSGFDWLLALVIRSA